MTPRGRPCVGRAGGSIGQSQERGFGARLTQLSSSRYRTFPSISQSINNRAICSQISRSNRSIGQSVPDTDHRSADLATGQGGHTRPLTPLTSVFPVTTTGVRCPFFTCEDETSRLCRLCLHSDSPALQVVLHLWPTD